MWPVYLYTASTNGLTTSNPATMPLRQNTVPPAVSRSFSRIVLNGTARFTTAISRLLGTLPATTNAVVLKPDGTRAYAYDSAAGGILVYDTSVDRDEAAYTALGAATPLAADPGTGVRMTITPDGGTLFIAAACASSCMPTPAG